MKNIFIEGLQGAGKSTLLENISKKFPKLHVCREGDYSPADLAWCAWMTGEEYQYLLEKFVPLKEQIIQNTVKEGGHYVVTYTKILTDIPCFHRELERFEIYNGRKSFPEFEKIVCPRLWELTEGSYLFECSFFQNIMEELILFQQLSDNEIIAFYHRLYNGINKENFQLLYLYSRQLEENIKIIKKERSDSQGKELWYPMMLQYLKDSPYGKKHGYHSFEDMVAHFRHRQHLELQIIHEIIGKHAIILPSKDGKIEAILRNKISFLK